MTPEERAKAVVEYFAASLPPAIGPQLENVIAYAIKRALNQKLVQLERLALAAEKSAHGRGKSAKGYDEAAIHLHREWAKTFRTMRNGRGACEP